MLVRQDDGTYQCGPLDVLCILHDPVADRYHSAFFQEHPLPGPWLPPEKTEIVRLKSKFHHTKGAADLKGALEHLENMIKTFIVPECNVWKDPIPWDSETMIVVWTLPNWRMEEYKRKEEKK